MSASNRGSTSILATSLLTASILGVLFAPQAMAQAAPAAPAAQADQPAAKPRKAQQQEEDVDEPQQASDAGQPQQSDEATELDTIVVTGIRQSLQSAQTIKRDSEQIVDSIVAEDIGKLPDITASASVARITGVQVNRAAGEAAQVQVRGLPDLSTTYNGRDIFTAENRNVALQDFPAGGVAGLDVYKSSTADLIEGGIAGQINVRARRPFDFPGREMFGAFNVIHTDQADKEDLNGNFLISNRWQTGVGEMGLLVNVAANRLRFLDSTREESLVVGVAQPYQTDQPGFRFPDAVATFYGEGQRTRPSVNAAFQWKPSDTLEVYADFLFQGFEGRDSDRFMFVPLFGAGLTTTREDLVPRCRSDCAKFSNVVLRPGTNQAQSLTVTDGRRPEGFQSAVSADTDTYQFGTGFSWHQDGLRWSGDIAYTDSEFTLSLANVDFAFAGTPVRDVNFDVPGDDGGPTYSFRDFDLKDPNNYIFRGLFDRNYEASGSGTQARTDFEFAPESGVIRAYQVGLRAEDRDADRRNGQRYAFWEPNGLRYTDLPLDFEFVGGGFEGDDHAPPRTWVSPTRNSIRWNIDQLRAIVGFPQDDPAFAALETFTASEKAYTAYGQVKYLFDAGIPIDGAIGIRAVRTETEVSGTSLDANDGTFSPITQSNRYTDYLPNVSARFRLSDEFQFRAAATKTRTRPNFDQLNPSTIFDPISTECLNDPQSPNCARTATGGNPDLMPLESKNYDLSFEYYFAPTGSATLALFRRDVQGFISRVTTEQPDPVYRVLRINRPENSGDGRLQGVEAAFTTFFDFDFVPEWAKAFGLQANYTYIDGEAELSPALAASLPGKPRVPGVSKSAYNLILLFEKPKFSARLAYNYRSEYVVEYAQIFDPGIGGSGPILPLVQDGRGVLDFATTWTPFPNLTYAFDVSNILGDPITNSRAYNAEGDEYPRQVKYLETLYSLGVRFRF